MKMFLGQSSGTTAKKKRVEREPVYILTLSSDGDCDTKLWSSHNVIMMSAFTLEVECAGVFHHLLDLGIFLPNDTPTI